MVRFLRSSSSPLCLFSLIILMLCLLFKLEEEPVVDLPGKKKKGQKKVHVHAQLYRFEDGISIYFFWGQERVAREI